MAAVLSEQQVRFFLDDGFVLVREAFPPELAEAGRALLWQEMGLRPDDPSGWTRPVIRLGGSSAAPFAAAANTTRLRGAFDQLVGVGRWRPRNGLGTWPIRFPHPDDPGDAGWHVEGSYLPPDEADYFLNLRSRDRALLMLFLFSNVSAEDAPTRIRVGSHVDIPRLLAPAGDAGRSFMEVAPEAAAVSAGRPVAQATGRAGDVYLCHPFLVHGAQPHRGRTVRFMAQPPLEPVGPLELSRTTAAYSPVEVAVRRGLGLS